MTKTSEHRYEGKYNRMFPMKTSVNTFITTYIMHLLDKNGSMYGKEMIDEMNRRFKGSWTPSHGLVYPILNELEKEGLIKGRWSRGSHNRSVKDYILTSKGKNVYKIEKKRAEKAFSDSLVMMELFMLDVYDEKMYDMSTI